MLDKAFQGTIEYWVDRGNSSGFGFVSYESGSRIDRVFFSHEDITPDGLGRRSHAKIIGSRVKFKLTKYLYKDQPSAKAVEVQSIFPSDAADPNHREVSVVEHVIKGSHQPIASVFLKRSSGDKLYLTSCSVAAGHKDRFHNTRIGDHVWSGVKPPTDGHPTWLATEAEFYSKAEEEAIRQEETKCRLEQSR
jgi:hypothetical protein